VPNLVGLGLHSPPKTLSFLFVTDSIARSATRRRYLSYSEADFELFRPTGATCCTEGVKFGTEEGTEGPSSVPNFIPIGATIRV